jgi:AraC-like DNA-binding protein
MPLQSTRRGIVHLMEFRTNLHLLIYPLIAKVPPMLLSKTETQKLRQVHDMLSTRLFCRITNKELQRKFCLSDAKLRKGFLKLYGMNTGHYHLTQRMMYAKALIENGEQIQEVSRRMGYSEASAFTHAFKRIFVNSPIRCKS